MSLLAQRAQDNNQGFPRTRKALAQTDECSYVHRKQYLASRGLEPRPDFQLIGMADADCPKNLREEDSESDSHHVSQTLHTLRRTPLAKQLVQFRSKSLDNVQEVFAGPCGTDPFEKWL